MSNAETRKGRKLRDEVFALIRFYERRGWDWADALEFIVREHNGTTEPWIIRTRIGV